VRDIAVLNEPIVLAFSVENVTNHRLVAQMRMDASALRLVISTEGAPAVTTRSAFAEEDTEGRPELYLGPREVVEESAGLFYGSTQQGRLFPRTGKYRIRGEMEVGTENGSIRLTDEIDVEVTPESADDDEFVKRLGAESDLISVLRSPELFCDGGSRRACVERLVSIARECARSSYAPIVFVGAVGMMEQPAARTVEGTSTQRLLEMWEESLRRWPGSATRALVMFATARSLMEVGRTQESAAMIKKYEAEFPHRRQQVHYLHASVLREPRPR